MKIFVQREAMRQCCLRSAAPTAHLRVCVDANGRRCEKRRQRHQRQRQDATASKADAALSPMASSISRTTIPLPGTNETRSPCECATVSCHDRYERRGVRPSGLWSSECWAVVGVLSVVSESGSVARQLLRRAWQRFEHPRSQLGGHDNVCFRFVLGTPCSGTNQTIIDSTRVEASRYQDVVWLDVDDSNCGQKSFAWLQHAAAAYSGAAWIGKADSDTFVQPLALAADLRTLPIMPARSDHMPAPASSDRHDVASDVPSDLFGVIVGQFSWASSWSRRPSSIGSSSIDRYDGLRPDAYGAGGMPCGRVSQLHDLIPRSIGDHAVFLSGYPHEPHCNISARRLRGASPSPSRPLRHARGNGPEVGPWPFAVGPLYLISASLAHAAFGGEAASRFAASHRFSCAAEDATVGYYVHRVAQARAAPLMLAHLTWAKLHNFDRHVHGAHAQHAHTQSHHSFTSMHHTYIIPTSYHTIAPSQPHQRATPSLSSSPPPAPKLPYLHQSFLTCTKASIAAPKLPDLQHQSFHTCTKAS